jgi:hypothetical protein
VAALVATGALFTLYATGGGNADVASRADRPASAKRGSAARLAPLTSRSTDLRRAMAAVPAIGPTTRARVESSGRDRSDRNFSIAAAVTPKPSESLPVETAREVNAEAADAASAASTGLVVRGKAKNSKSVWRVREGQIQHSTDGGSTWVDEYATDRTIVAGAFVAPEVAWLAGADGVILRRTPVGWFEASARADGDVASIRASSATKATITLADGRTFDTDNAGVAWTETQSDRRIGDDPRGSSAASKRPTSSRRRSNRSRR